MNAPPPTEPAQPRRPEPVSADRPPAEPAEPCPPGAARRDVRWIPTPVTPRYVAHPPPVLPWLALATGVLAVLALVVASALLVPALLTLTGAGFAMWRWRAARTLAQRMNDEVRAGPGRHARSDEPSDAANLVPGQRIVSPVPAAAGSAPVQAGHSSVQAGRSVQVGQGAVQAGRGPVEAGQGSVQPESGPDQQHAESTGTEEDRPGRHRAPLR